MSDKMYRFAVFLVAVLVWVEAEVDVRVCVETAAYNGACCRFNMTGEKIAMLRECTGNSKSDPSDPKNCDFETCYGLKAGFLFSNGTIDKTSFEAMIEEDFQNNSDVKELLKEKCLVDDLSFYALPDINMCEAKKIGNCLRVYTLLNCPQWQDSEHCNKVKDTIKECESVYP
ncbi:uncharacterized protein LOC123869468 isoform X1 [Maniola jurtina]|uniref:uncharacterized protein LOC123869468 isoform X1 n=1 Tax=Maniola jurtina TaxID=191418 RepID=UPI001E686385|nr:uncharacterized protein LOC123869468 isoform X1 [Maniola jurtina]